MFLGIGLFLFFCSQNIYWRQNCPIGIDQCELVAGNVTLTRALQFCINTFDFDPEEVKITTEGVIQSNGFPDHDYVHGEREWKIRVNEGYVIEIDFDKFKVIKYYPVQIKNFTNM